MSRSASSVSVVVIVAHPDDETLWSGGTILSHPTFDWYVVSLCRGNDPDRAPKFFKALKALGANGVMGNLDDGCEQKPLEVKDIESEILNLLPVRHFDTILSHSPNGEYTRHIRHEEIGEAVISLWNRNKISANHLWAFAFDDGNRTYLPRSINNATVCNSFSRKIWKMKYQIITEIYGFNAGSWEAKTTPKSEAFWQFTNPAAALKWLKSLK